MRYEGSYEDDFTLVKNRKKQFHMNAFYLTWCLYNTLSALIVNNTLVLNVKEKI